MDKGKGILKENESIEVDTNIGEVEKPEWIINLKKELSYRQVSSVPPLMGQKWMYVAPQSETQEADHMEIYYPYMVSLGPLLIDWNPTDEKMKKNNLLRNYNIDPDQLYAAFTRDEVDQLRNTYVGLHPMWQGDEFLHMMVTDGSFVLEFLRTERVINREGGAADNPTMASIFQDKKKKERCKHDILLLGNQLPMMLLLKLFHLNPTVTLLDLWQGIDSTFSYYTELGDFFPNEVTVTHILETSLHLLDFHRKMLVLCKFNVGKTTRQRVRLSELTNKVSAATELKKLGIRFTAMESGESILPRRLHTRLFLPQISIDDSTKSLFFNIINFEQHNKSIVGRGLSEEIYLMGCLVRSTDDVRLLMSEGVIRSRLSDDEIFRLLSRMVELITFGPDELVSSFTIDSVRIVIKNMKMRKEWRDDLFARYLKNPWTVLSIVVAFILLTCTILQTVYTVLGYVKPPPK